MTTPELEETTWFATAARGTERFLIGELKTFGAVHIDEVPGGVWFDGPVDVALRCCLWSRIASRVMALLGTATVLSEDDVYHAFRALPLDGWFHPDWSIACQVKSRGEEVKNSHFAALRMKDAVCDYVRETAGRRPNVDLDRPDITVAANIRGDTADFFVELQGSPLSNRGYRRQSVDAPLRENLAASLVLFSGWRGGEPLHDIVCGSATIPIEALWLVTDTAPGIMRRFAFERFPWFSEIENRWRELREEAEQRRRRTVEAPVRATDLSPSAIRIARRNARKADVGQWIEFDQKAVAELEPKADAGMYIGNPPYGERLLDDEGAAALHREIDALAFQSPGSSLCLVSAPELLKHHIRLKHSRILDTFNGPLAVRMALYEIRER